MVSVDFVPYCGSVPVPGTLTWNIAPVLICCLVAVAALYAIGTATRDGPTRREQLCFALGLAVAALALISPLCNLSVALFSARVGQHMVLTLVAAPLIVLGRPECALRGFGATSLRSLPWLRPNHLFVFATVAFAACIWVWHWPGPYDLTLRNNYVYWLMHLTMFGSALVLWYALIEVGKAHPGAALVAGFLTAMQMSMLGAVLTFAARPLFLVHATTTAAWQLSQLEDQQLGGLLMWVPGGLLFTAYALVAFAALLRSADQPNLGAARTS